MPHCRPLLGAVLASFLLASAHSQSLDGPWHGRLECSAPLPGVNTPAESAKPFTHGVELHSNRSAIAGRYEDAVSASKISGSLTGARMQVSLDGSRKDRPSWWQVVLSGDVVSGTALLKGYLLNSNGTQRLRECALNITSDTYLARIRESERRVAQDKTSRERLLAEQAAQAQAALDLQEQLRQLAEEQSRAVAEEEAASRARADTATPSPAKSAAQQPRAARPVQPPPVAKLPPAATPAASKAPTDKAMADKGVAEKAMAEKAAEKAAVDKAAVEKLAADKMAAEKAAAEKAAADQLAAEKAAAEKAAADKAAANRADAEKRKRVRANTTLDL